MKPSPIVIESLAISPFKTSDELLAAVFDEVLLPAQSLVGYVNVHVANQAQVFPQLKQFLQSTRFNYCDGAGIVLGAKLLGQTLPTRLTGADFFLSFLAQAAQKKVSIFLLGGQPGVSQAFVKTLNQKLPNHTVVGHHHGYVANDATLNQSVIETINRLKPDILIVGMGSPLQERWVLENRDQLNTSVIWPLGAVMDYFTGQQKRCPAWVGNMGLEWLYRLLSDPLRLYERYMIGNPWFFSRIFWQATRSKAQLFLAHRPLFHRQQASLKG